MADFALPMVGIRYDLPIPEWTNPHLVVYPRLVDPKYVPELKYPRRGGTRKHLEACGPADWRNTSQLFARVTYITL